MKCTIEGVVPNAHERVVIKRIVNCDSSMGESKMRAVGWQQRYMERFYNSRPGWVDGTGEFHAICRQNICGGKILEIGAGPCNRTSNHLASLGDLHGLDPDPDVKNNTALKTASV